MAPHIGIDLGTTHCAVACATPNGQVQILHNRDGDSTTASVVMFDGAEVFVGKQAKNQRALNPEAVAQFVKRFMGNREWTFQPPNGDVHTPESISAVILRRLVEDASMVLGEPVDSVVVTVPAYFSEAQRKATQDAGRIAGINVSSVINEPTAAAISFGVDADFQGKVLVYDLGGGTFDVTLLETDGQHFNTIFTDGDRMLGGFDFDNVIIEYIYEQMEELVDELEESEQLEAHFRDVAEQGKHLLTTMPKATLFVQYQGQSYKLPDLTRDAFEVLSESLLLRSMDVVERVIEGADVHPGEIDRVLLVGGSTRMPMVERALAARFGPVIDRSCHPDEAVARGAAITALARSPHREHTDVTINDVVSHGIGLQVIDAKGQLANRVIIKANTRIPAQVSDIFHLSKNQTSIELRITEGDDTNIDYVKTLGNTTLSVPYPSPGAPIEVTFSLDIDGVLHVELVDVNRAESLGEFEIDREDNLSQDAVQEAARLLSATEVR